MQISYVLLAITIGAGVAVQAGLNAQLRNYVGHPMFAALVNFVVGTLCRRIAVRPACAVAGGVRDEAGTGTVVAGRHARRVLRRFGGADRTQARRGRDVRAADRGGQVAMSLILEHYGWIGFPNHPLGLWRMVGGALLIMRVVLVVRS
ncbi:MAG: DMT family transporter [Burkholderiales bacterium]|nr:DMT family transporter [Burkholderiales bacterium]